MPSQKASMDPHLHSPSRQDRPPSHFTPHSPQCSLLVFVSTQMPPQDELGGSQPFLQSPPWQASSLSHSCPQAPQLRGSEASVVQMPLHRDCPSGQTQLPASQCAPPEHSASHSPQCSLLVDKSKHAWSQAVAGGAQSAKPPSPPTPPSATTSGSMSVSPHPAEKTHAPDTRPARANRRRRGAFSIVLCTLEPPSRSKGSGFCAMDDRATRARCPQRSETSSPSPIETKGWPKKASVVRPGNLKTGRGVATAPSTSAQMPTFESARQTKPSRA